MTDTAMTLNARDYKGPSGSKQMMTVAAMCLSSTKDMPQQKEIPSTVSLQEKTGESQTEKQKEH